MTKELSISGVDITNKWVVIRESLMKLEFRAMRHLIVQAHGGFGCSPQCIGSCVVATGIDGCTDRWERGDFERLATDEEVAKAKEEFAGTLIANNI